MKFMKVLLLLLYVVDIYEGIYDGALVVFVVVYVDEVIVDCVP